MPASASLPGQSLSSFSEFRGACGVFNTLWVSLASGSTYKSPVTTSPSWAFCCTCESAATLSRGS